MLFAILVRARIRIASARARAKIVFGRLVAELTAVSPAGKDYLQAHSGCFHLQPNPAARSVNRINQMATQDTVLLDSHEIK